MLPAATIQRRLPTRLVCVRYGVSSRTIRRWEIQKIIPAADFIIHARKYWLESTLDEHDRQTVATRGASAGPRHA